jgi:Tol biopolymer transport system component
MTSIKTDGSEYFVIERLFLDSPALSPDGQILAYTSEEEMRLYQWGSISYTIDLKEYGLTNWEVHFTSPPAWSPDGTQIACWARSNNKEGEFHGIVLLNLVTKASRVLQPLTHPIYWDSHPPAPEWSPDGQWLVFWGMDEDYYGRLGFWIVSANQGGMFVLAGNGDDIKHCADPSESGGRAWSPDGQWLAFNRCESDSGQGVWLAQVGHWKPLLVKLPSNARVVDWINAVQ